LTDAKYSCVPKTIDSKALAVGACIRTDGEIAKITSLYKHNGELVAEGKLYDDSSDICTDEIMIYPNWMEPIPVTNGDGRGNCVVIIKRSPACKLQAGLLLVF